MADNVATTSPARTWSPLRTLMAASCPPTSGATRISVVRTTPTMGAAVSEGDSEYRPTPATTRIAPTARVIIGVLTTCLSPLDQKCGCHCQCEIDCRQNPKAAPVARDLPQARAQLVD